MVISGNRCICIANHCIVNHGATEPLSRSGRLSVNLVTPAASWLSTVASIMAEPALVRPLQHLRR
jgi:hypothetical protein